MGHLHGISPLKDGQIASGSDLAVSVRGLCKHFHISSPGGRIREIFSGRNRGERLEVLKDLDFYVATGETLGLIGENGAGKSTLLKILSGVLEPSAGEVYLSSRPMSILELGIGLHPEFTGEENVFLYADILGIDRAVSRSKLSEIVEFAELGEAIRHPLKTYSSGMSARLAFSIVMAFSPKILILDEVLAVGDMYFQKKCVEKILEFKKGGGTIIFCSHDTYHVRVLCDRTLWLHKGRIMDCGETERVVSRYEGFQLRRAPHSADDLSAERDRPVYIEDVRLLTTGGIKKYGTIEFVIKTGGSDNVPYHILAALRTIQASRRVGIFACGSKISQTAPFVGTGNFLLRFEEVPLMGANFYLNVKILDGSGLVLIHEKDSEFFEIEKDRLDIGICHLKHSLKRI